MGNIVIIKMRLVSVVLLYIRSIILPVIRRQASFDSKRARAQCHDDAGGSSLYHKIPLSYSLSATKLLGECSTIFACTHCQTLIIITRFAPGGEMNVPASKAPVEEVYTSSRNKTSKFGDSLYHFILNFLRFHLIQYISTSKQKSPATVRHTIH